MAARSNALFMVVRLQDWRPRDGDSIHGCALDAAVSDDNCQNSCGLGFLDKSTTTGLVEMINLHVSASELKSDTSHNTNSREGISHVRAPYAHYAPKSKWAQLEFFMLQSYRFRAMSLDQQLIRVGDIQLHGLCQLPPGYTLCFVPLHVAINPRHTSSGLGSSMAISSQFSALQVLWSISQTCIGSYTLYQSKGSQLDIYGYAAFGLTVIPYVIASIIDLLASLVSRQYDNVFLVHSSIMDEAINRGAVVDGVVGSIDRVKGEGENLTSDDELGKLGNSAVVFRGNMNVEGQFTCEVDMAEDLLAYTLMPPENPSFTPPTKIKRLKKISWISSKTLPKLTSVWPLKSKLKRKRTVYSAYPPMVPSPA
ncbi:hypothetical protein BPAE_0099g00210 [Botrytis paeoniae]|uniref:Uncharacterized protein n=1 Tax=Botrytis paeoniae TaxID=278948 RepID=A0A4Z1FJE7_9HELO|nr:hypothetical protein BPAE_0099g00210 [Botrytis paeoniae]